MLNSLWNSFFGCSHQRTTFPMTPKRGPVGSGSVPAIGTATYVACLDCGQELAYDWKSMRVGEAIQPPASLPQVPLETQPIFRVPDTLLSAWIRR